MMRHHSLLGIITIAILLITAGRAQAQLRVGVQPDGSILVPTNQTLRPAGQQILLPGRPVDIHLSPDGKWLVVKNSRSLDLIRTSDLTLVQTLSMGAGASFTGLELSPDGKAVWVTDEEQTLRVARIDAAGSLSWSGSYTVPAPAVGGKPVPTGLSLDGEKGYVYVLSSRGNCLWKIRLSDGQSHSIRVGVAPYDIVLLSPAKAYVTNWGGRSPLPDEPQYKTSGTLVRVDGKTGIADSGTVSVVDLAQGKEVAQIDVGLHPSGMALSPDGKRLYVACANSDTVAVIDTAQDTVVEQINVRLRKDLPFGSAPNALDVSPDGSRLYAANGTDNAVCVIDLASQDRVAGFIPTGWYPGSLALDSAGKKLYVANVKGVGSLSHAKVPGNFAIQDYLGSVSAVGVPTDRELDGMTAIVERNNSLDTLMANLTQTHTRPGSGAPAASPLPRFSHVIYIIRENKTYDQVLGDVITGDGDPRLVVFGREVTPNGHALAERFGLLDNFYCSGAVSADGHQWTDEAYTTDYLEKFFGDFTRSYPYSGGDPLAYASSGFIWDNVLRGGLTFRDYGEFASTLIAPKGSAYKDIFFDYQRGTSAVSVQAEPNLAQLSPYLCRSYAGFNLKVPDVHRAAAFISELRQFEAVGSLPSFIIMLLPNDHTAGTTPGYPTPRSMVADNDLALGMIVEAVTHSPFWKDTCILVTEDDPQSGIDHVDSHRTVGLVISPYSRQGAVISTTYSQINMVSTVEALLGLPPMNRFDLGATPMADCFTATPDYTPFHALPNRVPLNQTNAPLYSLSGPALYWAGKSLEQDLSQVDRIDEDVFNRIIWHSVKGWDAAYPVPSGTEED